MPLDVKGDETNEKESSKNIFPRNHFISLPLIITEEPRMSVHIIQIKALLILQSSPDTKLQQTNGDTD